MSIQHLLLSSDGDAVIIEADQRESELVTPPIFRP